MKTIEIPFELRADVKAGEVVNLREADGALTPVGDLQTLGVKDVGSIWPMGRGFTLCVETDGQTLVVVKNGGRVERPGAADGRVVGVCRGDSASWWVMTDAGPELLTLNDGSGRFELLGPPPGFGAVRLGVADGGQYSAVVEPQEFAGSYKRGSGALTADDAMALGASMVRAYEAMSYRAAISGGRFQPVLAAWRLLDEGGQELFRSVPQWLGPQCGFSFCGEYTTPVGADGSNYCKPEPFGIAGRAWRMTVRADASALGEEWKRRCSRLEILATRPIEFIDPATAPEAALSVASTTGASTLRAFMPGASKGYSTDVATLRGLLAKALTTFGAEAETVAVFSNPFDGGLSVEKTVVGRYSGVKPLAAKPKRDIDLPNRFVASASYESGTMTVHGDVTAIGSAGPVAGDISAETNDEEYRQQSVVTLADGTTLVTDSKTEVAAPRMLPPIIVCPAADAVKLTFQVGNEAMDVALTTSACGHWSFWQAEGFEPVAWKGEVRLWKVEKPTAKPQRFPSAIICAGARTPMNPESFHTVCRGQIMRVTQAAGAEGGWNYGRQHLLLWTDEGVFALSVDRSMTAAGSSMLYGVGVGRRDAVVVTPQGAYAALTDGRLIRMRGTKVTDIKLPVKAVSVGWVDSERELWAIDSSGTPCIVTSAGGIYFRKPIKLKSTAEPGVAVTKDNELVDMTQELRAEETEVRWSRRVEAALSRSSIATWVMDSELADVKLGLTGDSGGAETKISELHFIGQLNAPLSARIYSPSRRWITVSVEGRLTAPSRLGQLVIQVCKF